MIFNHPKKIFLPIFPYFSTVSYLVKGFQLIGLNWSFISVKVIQWVFGTVVVSVIVCIDSLRFQTSDGIEFLDRCGTKSCERAKDSSLDFRNFCVFYGVYECILRFSSMILQFLCCIFLSEGSDFVEVHFKVMADFVCQFCFDWLVLELNGVHSSQCRKKSENLHLVLLLIMFVFETKKHCVILTK